MSFVPKIWAETMAVSLYRSLMQPNETLEETKQRMHRQWLEHEKRMAEDPEYAKHYEELQREFEEQWHDAEECDC